MKRFFTLLFLLAFFSCSSSQKAFERSMASRALHSAIADAIYFKKAGQKEYLLFVEEAERINKKYKFGYQGMINEIHSLK